MLQLVAQSGSDVAAVMSNDMAIGARDLNLRLRKLVALGFLGVVDEQHGPQLTLTSQGTDTLALPVSLFTWQTDDLELLQELASARLALEERQPQKVVVACARCCERMLRGLLAAHEPPVASVGGKDVGRATLWFLTESAASCYRRRAARTRHAHSGAIMRANIIGGVLGVAFLAVGCGAPIETQEPESAMSTREDALPACNGEAYERAFYSDASMTTQVGGWECWCGNSSAYIWGKTTSFSEYLYINECSL